MKTIKVCRFCEAKVQHIDFKDEKKLQKFITEQGKIIPKRITGTCASHHRMLTTAIKRARAIAVLPYVSEIVK